MAMPSFDTPLLRGPFTVDDYYRMAEVGLLDSEVRTELLDGQVVELTPIGPDHATCVNRLTMFFARRVPEGVTVSVQNPVIASLRSAPQPDVALVRLAESPRLPGPADVLLLIEVADTSLVKDRDIKAPLYARAGIREYWLADLAGRRVTVYAEPSESGYRATRTCRDRDLLAPTALPELQLTVADVLG